MTGFSFEVTHQDKKTRARTGCIHTPHGDIETPAFVPVGTQAAVKSLTPPELDTLGVQLFFVNTYHMYLRPGLPVISKVGGIHKFMNWNKPLITDSGGFQIFSLSGNKKYAHHKDMESSDTQLVKITDTGVLFRSHWDGSLHTFTPKSSMEFQWTLGSDIHIAFDDCTPYPVSEDGARASLTRTHRWAGESLETHKKLWNIHKKRNKPYQALYGSVQGSVYETLRKESAGFIASMDFDGIAIGGVSVGESKAEMRHVLAWSVPYLPRKKPLHLLGVGETDDIFTLIEEGVDTFDCVQPTRLARTGHVYKQIPNPKSQIPINRKAQYTFDITKSLYAKDTKPIDEHCLCYTCRNFSRAYINHLFRVRELLGYRLATIHNIHFVNTLVSRIRRAIQDGTFKAFKAQWLSSPV